MRELEKLQYIQWFEYIKIANRIGGLPSWPKYATGDGETMVLDDICELKNDPDREARKTLSAS